MSSSVKQPKRPYKKFTPEEDEMILEWGNERYKRLTQKTGPLFTEEEQKLLIEKVKEYGQKWHYIAEHFFPHHNEFTLKNRYNAWKRKCARPKKTKPRIHRKRKCAKQENEEEQQFEDRVISVVIIPDDLDL